MKRISLLILSVISLISLFGCSIPVEKPTSGIWYCEELKIAIDFGAIEQRVPEDAWLYSDDGTVIPLRCHIDYGNGISFEKLDSEGNEVFYLSALFYYENDRFVITVHHMSADDGTMVEIDDEKYVFVLSEGK